MKLKQSPGYPFFRIAFPRFRAIAGYLIFASLYGLELPSASAQDIIGVIVPAKPQPAEDIAADMVLQSGHSGRVTGLVFSSDGDMLASAGDDKTIQLWNVAQGRQIFCLRGHTGAVRAIAFSPDGSHLASGSDDHTIRLWAVQTGKFLATLQMPNESAVHLAFSPDGSRLVAAGGGPYEGGAGPVVLWDVATGREIRTLELENRIC
jgi:WD40 repeat protein